MERSLVKQGRNALTVTLPASWLKERGLQAGDTVSVIADGDDLILAASRQRSILSVTIDLRGLETSSLWHLTSQAYVKGADEIVILHSNPKFIEQIAGNLLGFLIDEHTATRTVLKSMIQVPSDDTSKQLRRAGHLFVQLARSFEGVALGINTVLQVKSDERLLDNTLLYLMRSLGKYHHEREHELFLFCAWIEMAGDMVSIMAAHIGTRKKLAEQTRNIIETYVAAIFANDYKKLYISLRAYRSGLRNAEFVEGVAFTLADMLYNNIGSFVVDPRHQNI